MALSAPLKVALRPAAAGVASVVSRAPAIERCAPPHFDAWKTGTEDLGTDNVLHVFYIWVPAENAAHPIPYPSGCWLSQVILVGCLAAGAALVWSFQQYNPDGDPNPVAALELLPTTSEDPDSDPPITVGNSVWLRRSSSTLDDFEGVAGQDMTLHLSNPGIDWGNTAMYNALGPSYLLMDGSGNLWTDSSLGFGGSNAGALSNWVPASADYYVQIATSLTAGGSGTQSQVILQLRSNGTDTCYALRYAPDLSASGSGNYLVLEKTVGGSFTPNVASFDDGGTFTAYGAHVVRFEVFGNSIRAWLDSYEVISHLDSDIAAAGKAGISITVPGGTRNSYLVDYFAVPDAYRGTSVVVNATLDGDPFGVPLHLACDVANRTQTFARWRMIQHDATTFEPISIAFGTQTFEAVYSGDFAYRFYLDGIGWSSTFDYTFVITQVAGPAVPAAKRPRFIAAGCTTWQLLVDPSYDYSGCIFQAQAVYRFNTLGTVFNWVAS